MSIKLLVVDDEAYMTQLVGHALQKAGHTVLMASDGEEAYALARREVPDLIVSDFQMPGLNGYELALRLMENRITSDIPVIMLTARGHKLDQEQLAKTNIRQLLPKPFSARQLKMRIAEVLGDAVAVDEQPDRPDELSSGIG